MFCVGKLKFHPSYFFLAGTQRAGFHAVSINLPLQEEDGREPRGKFRRFLQPRKTHRHLSTPSKFVYARPLEFWPLRELIGDVYKVANMTCAPH